MTDNAAPLPRKGDWVKVWALVTDADPHPEEYSVRLESHSDHYVGLVRRDHVEGTARPPSFAPRCPSMHEAALRGVEEVFVRCQRTDEHTDKHRHGDVEWEESAEYGAIEENSYRH